MLIYFIIFHVFSYLKFFILFYIVHFYHHFYIIIKYNMSSIYMDLLKIKYSFDIKLYFFSKVVSHIGKFQLR